MNLIGGAPNLSGFECSGITSLRWCYQPGVLLPQRCRRSTEDSNEAGVQELQSTATDLHGPTDPGLKPLLPVDTIS